LRLMVASTLATLAKVLRGLSTATPHRAHMTAMTGGTTTFSVLSGVESTAKNIQFDAVLQQIISS
jgi:hypothetical protein